MDKKITYAWALTIMSSAITTKILDAFKASSLLAMLFDMEKEQTMDDLMKTIEELYD
jgi:hypothetical protein